jgi:hypothetical protein
MMKRSAPEFQGAPDERQDLVGRVLDHLEMRPDEIERGQQVGVDLFILVAERVAALKGHAPLGVAEKAEELDGQIVQPIENAVQLLGAEFLAAAHGRDIAPQLLQTVVADGNAEVLGGDVFDVVGFVEHHGVVCRQDSALVVFVPEGQVREKQVVIDDDDVALRPPAGASG